MKYGSINSNNNMGFGEQWDQDRKFIQGSTVKYIVNVKYMW